MGRPKVGYKEGLIGSCEGLVRGFTKSGIGCSRVHSNAPFPVSCACLHRAWGYALEFGVCGLGFRVWGLRSRVWIRGLVVHNLWHEVVRARKIGVWMAWEAP